MKNSSNCDLGRRIKEARAKAGVSQCQLAEMIDMSDNHMSDIERGLYDPHVEAIRRISVALDVSADSLLFDAVEDGRLKCAVDAARALPEDVQLGVANIIEAFVEVQRARTVAALGGCSPHR